MRALPEGLQAHLDSGATTLCWCWKVIRADGATLGFTDHDNDLTFAGTLFEASSGFTATDTRQAVGLNVDNSEIDGALQSGRITDLDLANGLYENARVELYRVNWSAVSERVLMRVATIGEITRNGHAFQAELRGLSHVLGQTQGRTYQSNCDADLGDGRCGVDLSSPGHTIDETVAEVISATQFAFAPNEDVASGWFAFGQLTWTSGANGSRSVQIKNHRITDGLHVVHLWEQMRGDIQVGDTFEAVVGCDKRFATCGAKFSNVVNFRGFPHLPGQGYVTFYPNSDDPR